MLEVPRRFLSDGFSTLLSCLLEAPAVRRSTQFELWIIMDDRKLNAQAFGTKHSPDCDP